MKWTKLNPKIAVQVLAVLVLVIGDVINQVATFYPHATWLPLLTVVGVVVIGYLKSAEKNVPVVPDEVQAGK